MNNYVEIVTDENGESHFKDVTLVFDAVDIAPPAAPMNVSPFIPAKDVAVIHLPSGWAGGWHPAPSVGHVFVLSGQLSIEVSDGEVRQFPSGAAWLHRSPHHAVQNVLPPHDLYTVRQKILHFQCVHEWPLHVSYLGRRRA